MKKYGKFIKWSKFIEKKPSSQVSNMPSKSRINISKLGQYKQGGKFGTDIGFPRLPYSRTGFNPNNTAWAQKNDPNYYTPKLVGPFYNYLLDNCIVRTTNPPVTGTVTTLTIKSLPANELFKDGDVIWIYNIQTFTCKKLTVDGDHASGDTTLTFASTTFNKNDFFPSGSFIIRDTRDLIETVNGGLLYKKYTIANPEYTDLSTNPLVLLSGVSNYIHMPISCYIRYIHGADEMTIADLYIGHNASSTMIGEYWGSLDAFAYRYRNNALFQIGASTYGAGVSGNYSGIGIKSKRNDGVGNDLTLYTTTDFTSASSTMELYLWYQTIKV